MDVKTRETAPGAMLFPRHYYYAHRRHSPACSHERAHRAKKIVRGVWVVLRFRRLGRADGIWTLSSETALLG